jgi:diguanylate cyclase (GGDEF)-like protein/PAS domain S-box-containing protein
LNKNNGFTRIFFFKDASMNFPGWITERGSRAKGVVSAIFLVIYFPLLLAVSPIIGEVGLAAAFVPSIAWAILLGPQLGFIGSLLLFFPNYAIGRAQGSLQTSDELVQLVASHLVIGVLTYVVGAGYRLRTQLSRELRLRKAGEARFRGLFDHTNDAVFISDIEMIIRDVNSEALRLLGYKREEIIGKPYSAFVAPEERVDLQTRMDQVRVGDKLPVYERTYIRKDGKPVTVEISAASIKNQDGAPSHYQTISRDITDRKTAQKELYYRATHDDLTGLFNRAMFIELVNRGVERSQRDKRQMAVLFIDLDNFKTVNDNHGHLIGDAVLQVCANRLTGLLRKSDVIARVGGDEFTVVIEPIEEKKYGHKIAKSIESSLGAPFDIEGKQIDISASVGIGFFPDDATDAEALLRKADQLMYAVKHNNKRTAR